jgi:chemotaxis protein MotB
MCPLLKGGPGSILVKGTGKQPEELIPQWQTIYCSLMLLLVVFFVMLIAHSSIDRNRFMGKKYMQKSSRDIPEQAPDLGQAMQSLQQLTGASGMSREFSIIRTENGFKAVVPNPVLFASGDVALNKAVYPILDGIIDVAKKNDLLLQIEGHTDNIPITTAKFPSNWELSTLRAVNILRYLQDHGGIPPNRLVAVGFAEYQPVASNDSPEGRQKNRRIEIRFRSGT